MRPFGHQDRSNSPDHRRFARGPGSPFGQDVAGKDGRKTHQGQGAQHALNNPRRMFSNRSVTSATLSSSTLGSGEGSSSGAAKSSGGNNSRRTTRSLHAPIMECSKLHVASEPMTPVGSTTGSAAVPASHNSNTGASGSSSTGILASERQHIRRSRSNESSDNMPSSRIRKNRRSRSAKRAPLPEGGSAGPSSRSHSSGRRARSSSKSLLSAQSSADTLNTGSSTGTIVSGDGNSIRSIASAATAPALRRGRSTPVTRSPGSSTLSDGKPSVRRIRVKARALSGELSEIDLDASTSHRDIAALVKSDPEAQAQSLNLFQQQLFEPKRVLGMEPRGDADGLLKDVIVIPVRKKKTVRSRSKPRMHPKS